MIDVISIIEDNSILNPNDIALIFESEVLTYGHLNEIIGTVSCGLHYTCNVNKGDIVAFYAERNLDTILLMLSTLKLGATFLPIAPNLPLERIKEIVQLSKPKVTVIFNEIKPERNDLSTVTEICYLSEIVKIKSQPLFVESLDNELLAYVLFTSGSTGTPKGVKIQRKSVNNLIGWAIKNLVSGKIVVAGLTRVTFDLSILDLFTALSSGGIFVMFSERDLSSPANLLRRIKISRCNFVQTVPSLWCEALEFLSMLDYSKAIDLVRDIKTLILAGEQLHSKLLKKWILYAPDDNEVINMYGPTETIHATFHKISKSEINRYDEFIPIGKPIDNIYLKILNEYDNISEDDELGELHIGGISISSGYISTNNNLKDDKFYSDNSEKISYPLKWYKTGDIVRQKGNQIYFVGRKDDQIKIAGHRMHLSDIENIALKNTYIDSAVAVYTNILLLFYTSTSKEFKENDVIKYLLKYFPLNLLPNKIIKISHIPLTSNGKVDKASLIKSCEIQKSEVENVFSISPDRLYFIEREKLGKNLIEHPQVTSIVSFEVNKTIILEVLKRFIDLNEIFRIQPYSIDDRTFKIIPGFSDYDLQNTIVEIKLKGNESRVLEKIVNSISKNDILFKEGPLFRISFAVLKNNKSIISIRCHHAIASGTEVLGFTNFLCESIKMIAETSLPSKNEIKLNQSKWDDQVDNPKVVLNKKTFNINGELRGLIHLNESGISFLKTYFSKRESSLAKGLLCIHIKTLNEIYNNDVIAIESPILNIDNQIHTNSIFDKKNIKTRLPVEMVRHKYSNLFQKTLDELLKEIIISYTTTSLSDICISNRWNYVPATSFISCKMVEEIIPFDLFEPLPPFSESLESSVLAQYWNNEVTLILRFKKENFLHMYIQKFVKNVDLLYSI